MAMNLISSKKELAFSKGHEGLDGVMLSDVAALRRSARLINATVTAEAALIRAVMMLAVAESMVTTPRLRVPSPYT